MFDRMRTGAAFGLIMATLYSGWVLVLFLVKGNAPFEANDVTAWAVVLSYYATGVIAGGVVGLLAPLVHSRFGATIVGWVAAFL